MRHRSVRLALAVLGVLTSIAPNSAASAATLSPAGEAEFPHRAFVLTLPPGQSVDPGQVQVVENGHAVRDLSVTAADAAPASDSEFGTVLVIDTSNSMQGRAIEQAMAAARTFAGQRHSSHKLGLVTFDRTARALLEPTSESGAIQSALAATPALRQQTHMRDGVMAALDALRRADVSVGSVIVLSDGADTGSRASIRDVAAAARARGVRIFTVGLESRAFDQGTLVRIARAGGGEHVVAPSARELEHIYEALGERLSQEYLIRYGSVEGPATRVRVEVVAPESAGRATLTYRSPKLAAAPLPPGDPKANGFWGSAAVMVVVGFGSAFLVCFGLAWLLIDRRRPETAEERVAAFVAMGAPEQEEAGPKTDMPGGRLDERIERRLRDHRWWQQFSLDVEIARIERAPARIAVMTGVATLVTMWLFVAISGARWVAVFAFLIPWGVRKIVAHRSGKQRVLFGEQLVDNLQVVASAMRAGQSFTGALAAAAEDAPEPAKAEFERVVADEQLGVPIETALAVVVERMKSNDLQQVALVASLQREAGGNAAEVLERVAETIRERVALRRLIATLTAQGRMSRWVVSFIPVALVMLIGLSNPTYLDPLLTSTAGNVVLAIAALMVVAGSMVIQKIVDIEA